MRARQLKKGARGANVLRGANVPVGAHVLGELLSYNHILAVVLYGSMINIYMHTCGLARFGGMLCKHESAS